MKGYRVVRQTRSIVYEGSFGGDHPYSSAICDHADAINEMSDNAESLTVSERAEIRRLVRRIHQIAWRPISDAVSASIEANKHLFS